MPASILGEAGGLPEVAEIRSGDATLLNCPSCGSAHVAQVLGDNGGVSYVCTACGHSWS
ncbi:hypothetical protein [Streptomyces sp. AN091965]|uniref:hypothetical protein n=1 Tax=Streptomyces sp. AN091965 TaxID=2927803 RepID=UPI001F61D9E7|nr:hypothetical protein [Streptomyces sp. AN091965]MCI3930651.1 hypothetical protein [Streptomyces sp. AN091965]